MSRATALALLLLALPAFAAATPSPAAKAAFDRGEKELADGRNEQAIAAYKEALTATPGYAAALNGLGVALFKLGRKEDAVAQYRAATDADAGFKLAWYNLGYASRKLQDFKTAAAAYEKYTALDPADPDGFYGLAESYKALGDTNRALAAYDAFIKKETRPTEQKYVDRAKQSIAELRAAPAAPVAAPVGAAPVAAPTAAAPGATADTMPAQPQPSLPGAAGKKLADGDRAMAEKRYRDASFAYTDAVHADPNSVEGRFKLGNSLAVLGYYQQAVDQWTYVTKLSKDPAVLAQAQGNITKAQAKIAQVGSSPPAAGKPPGSGPVAETSRTQARALYEQGIAQIRARDYGNALASLSSAVQLEPALTVGYLARGSALVGLRRFSEAALDYGYALKLEPSSAAPLYGLAVSYQGLSRTDDARQYFQKYIASTAPDVRPELQTDARNNLEKLKP